MNYKEMDELIGMYYAKYPVRSRGEAITESDVGAIPNSLRAMIKEIPDYNKELRYMTEKLHDLPKDIPSKVKSVCDYYETLKEQLDKIISSIYGNIDWRPRFPMMEGGLTGGCRVFTSSEAIRAGELLFEFYRQVISEVENVLLKIESTKFSKEDLESAKVDYDRPLAEDIKSPSALKDFVYDRTQCLRFHPFQLRLPVERAKDIIIITAYLVNTLYDHKYRVKRLEVLIKNGLEIRKEKKGIVEDKKPASSMLSSFGWNMEEEVEIREHPKSVEELTPLDVFKVNNTDHIFLFETKTGEIFSMELPTKEFKKATKEKLKELFSESDKTLKEMLEDNFLDNYIENDDGNYYITWFSANGETTYLENRENGKELGMATVALLKFRKFHK